jgi:hypothetical protein
MDTSICEKSSDCPFYGMFADGKISVSKFIAQKQQEKGLERIRGDALRNPLGMKKEHLFKRRNDTMESNTPINQIKGEKLLDCGAVYNGDLVNGVPDGKGSFAWKNGDAYIGEVKEGKMHGKGSLAKKDGTILIGNWNNGEFEG